MEKTVPIQSLLGRATRLPWVTGGLALAVLAGAVVLTTLQVRHSVRQQIARRDGEVLHAVMMREYADDVAEGWAGPIADSSDQLSLVLKASELRGVLGVRLYDTEGKFVDAFPVNVCDAELDSGVIDRLRELKPVCRFHAMLPVEAVFSPDATELAAPATPVLEVNVPLHPEPDAPLAGIAQLLLEGSAIAAEYERLDRQLAAQALVTFGLGGTALTLVLVWAFRRLRRAHALITDRTESLVKANQELALAAKTTALGAVAAHLIHGLKNPLAGLQNFVSAQHVGQTSGNGTVGDWQQAVASTRRMQNMIQRVVSVLHEEETSVYYEVSLAELAAIVSGQVQPLAQARSVNLKLDIQAEGELPNRVAHLVALILENLAQNGVEATPPGRSVSLSAVNEGRSIRFEVRDEGSGFGAGEAPFTPCRSAKEGGSGIGLALSKQLAHHLGAALELKENSANGCVFALTLPANARVEKADELRATLAG